MVAERLGAVMISILLINACAASATDKHTCPGQQIIISFAPGVDVMYAGFTAGLSGDAGLPIEYMRHLFDDHHLYCAKQDTHTPGLDEARQRLQERADILTVEIDRRKRPGSNQ